MVLKAIPQQDFQNCFLQWQRRWTKCLAAKVDLFEGDPYL